MKSVKVDGRWVVYGLLGKARTFCFILMQYLILHIQAWVFYSMIHKHFLSVENDLILIHVYIRPLSVCQSVGPSHLMFRNQFCRVITNSVCF